MAHAAALANRWATFTRATSIYPAMNHRIRDAMTLFLDALRKALAEAATPPEVGLRAVFSGEEFLLGKERIPIEKDTVLGWLSERVQWADLVGVDFLPGLTEASLLAFTAHLLDLNKRRGPDRPFREPWVQAYEGLRVLDRRFDGFFDDAAAAGQGGGLGQSKSTALGKAGQATQTVARLIAQHPQIREYMDRLRVQFQSDSRGNERTRRIDLLERIVDLLPHDAMGHYDQAVEVVLHVLEDLAGRLEHSNGEDDVRAFTDETTLNQLVFATSRGVLGARTPTTEEIATRLVSEKGTQRVPPGKRTGVREGDEAIVGNVDLLWEDLADLPPPHSGELTTANAESPLEQLGVYLHFLVDSDEEGSLPGLYPRLAELLGEAGPRRQQILAEYLEATQESSAAGFGRLLAFLRDNNLYPLLRTCGFLSAANVVHGFPRHFGLYLTTLDAVRRADLDELDGVLDAVGPERVREAEKALVLTERILEESCMGPILARPSTSLRPLLRIALARGGESVRAKAIGILPRLRIDVREACLLYVWDDPKGLPIDYLVTITDPEHTTEDLAGLHSQISSEICRFLESTVDRSDRDERRIYAIQHLGVFFDAGAEYLLDHIVHDRSLGLLHKQSKAVRDAARRALDWGREQRKETPDV